jgi:hypothetical protein
MKNVFIIGVLSLVSFSCCAKQDVIAELKFKEQSDQSYVVHNVPDFIDLNVISYQYMYDNSYRYNVVNIKKVYNIPVKIGKVQTVKRNYMLEYLKVLKRK